MSTFGEGIYWLNEEPRSSDVVPVDTTEETTHPPDPPPARFLTTKEAMSHFGIAERTVRLWLAQGRLRGYQQPEKGRVSWRIWSVEGEEPPCNVEGVEGQKIHPVPVPDLPPAADVVTIAREQFHELLSRHELACRRIGALEEALASRLPAIEGRLPLLAEGTDGLREEVKALAAVGAEDRRRIRGRLRGMAVALAVLAVLMAAVGTLALTARGERIPRSIPRPPRSIAPPARSPDARASLPAGTRGPSGTRP